MVYEDGDAEELSEKDIRKIIARDGSRPSLQSSDRAIYENVTSIDQDDETRKNSGKRLSQLKGSHGVKKMRVVIETPSATDNLQPMEIPASMTVDEELAEGTGKERSSNFSQAISFLFKAPMPTISALDQGQQNQLYKTKFS